jgi:NADPH:quinone reductase-like Zn-dependent oxidoreductase
MKAVVINQYGSKEELVEKEVNKPSAEANQVVVKLEATSINPIDWKLREGYLKDMYDVPALMLLQQQVKKTMNFSIH